MKITRVLYSKRLNAGKYAALEEQARRLGRIRTEVWRRFGSISGVGLTDRQVRDAWLREGRRFAVPANAWKETLRDAMADIKAHREAAKVKVRQAIRRHIHDEEARKRLYTLLKQDAWTKDPYLRRLMRRYWRRGHNHTHNQIVVRSDSYTVFEQGGRCWIKVPGLERGKRIAIPLDTTIDHAPSGTLRLILRDGVVEVHVTVEAPLGRPCGDRELGVDKGYTEAFVDSDGDRHGEALGTLLQSESDCLKTKYQRRAKLLAIAKNTKNERKRQNILRHNLGRKKLNRRAARVKARIRDEAFKAAHAVVDKAAVIAAEDLTAPMSGRAFSKNMNRRLAAWTKGVLAEALETVSQRRGSTLVLVNAAYTSQIDSRNGCLLGRRRGDRFYCFDGAVLQADVNAARNVLARLRDPEIDRWTPYCQVRAILQARTERLRLGLLNQDSSCRSSDLKDLSTESESPNAQMCASF
ncbi:hypothetical protein MIN45_P0420 [Methylomarinovum tepidoasis]|uniref:Cas12f1-like TNB domain-containing protein n=1 Tax=Methylomarinovum tepidoasis TaxID=2840183 RepID=A0AAU9CP34_9GAMM|nr:transposase [Methylomarinovum sp. IN45]BCX88053.1 hypothetical protein MIN45_P0420 [Methylomarinovum sp. IN45]